MSEKNEETGDQKGLLKIGTGYQEDAVMKKAMETTLTGAAAAISQMLEDSVKRITEKEWKEEGIKRFGQDPTKWRFVCPNCKHVQTIQDFIDIRDLGMFVGSAEIAFYSCIGRFDTRIPRSKVGTLGDPKEYCDYTIGGLFPLVKTVVIRPDGKENSVFEFAEADVSATISNETTVPERN